MATLMSILSFLAISILTVVVGGGVLEALRRRNIDPQGAIARFLSPDLPMGSPTPTETP